MTEVLREPVINTIIQEKTSTTTVLTAVATSESVSFIPHLARIEVSPANKADIKAITSHIKYTSQIKFILKDNEIIFK